MHPMLRLLLSAAIAGAPLLILMRRSGELSFGFRCSWRVVRRGAAAALSNLRILIGIAFVPIAIHFG